MTQGEGTYGSKIGRPPETKKSGFKMKGWSAFTKPDEYEPQTKTKKDISTDIDPASIKKPGLFEDISGSEMEAYIKKIDALGDNATKKQKDLADDYRRYMD